MVKTQTLCRAFARRNCVNLTFTHEDKSLQTKGHGAFTFLGKSPLTNKDPSDLNDTNSQYTHNPPNQKVESYLLLTVSLLTRLIPTALCAIIISCGLDGISCQRHLRLQSPWLLPFTWCVSLSFFLSLASLTEQTQHGCTWFSTLCLYALSLMNCYNRFKMALQIKYPFRGKSDFSR